MSGATEFTDNVGNILIVQPSSIVLLNGWATAFSWFLAYFFLSRYILEPLMPLLYRNFYPSLSIPDQRSFTIHHHWLIVKFCAIPAAWPYINIMFRSQPLAAPLFPGAAVTNADFLSVMYMAITTSFAWEICYRCKISLVSLIHHAAAIVLGCWQLSGETASVQYTTTVPAGGSFIDTRANDQQFKIIMTYGIFEVVFESWMHICCILHKRYTYSNRHLATARLWALGGCWVFLGSLAELGIMAVLWKQFWADWEVSMKVIMIVLHFAFMAAQLHGARIGLLLFKKYRRKAISARETHQSLPIDMRDVTVNVSISDGSDITGRDLEKGRVEGAVEGKEKELSLVSDLLIPVEARLDRVIDAVPILEKGVGELEEEVKGR